MDEIPNFDAYETAHEYWSKNENRSLKSIVAGLAHLVDAKGFIQQLQLLHTATGDQRFMDALEALNERGLVSGFKWAAPTPFPPINDLENQFNSGALDIVYMLVESGVSLRLALASAAAIVRRSGNSFEAATKSLERLWRGRYDSKP